MGSTFSENFHEALSADDQKFAEYIAGMSRYSDFCKKSPTAQAQISPLGPQREQYLGELTRPNGTVLGANLEIKLRPRPPEPQEYALTNRTGIASLIYGTSNNPTRSYSVDKVAGSGLSIAPDKCIPCLPPAEAEQLYKKSDINDPAQRRASQLMRMFISLHEVGHAHFESNLGFFGQKTAGGDNINPSDIEQTERYADTFALTIMIRELGQEGTRFAKQILSGLRDQTHGSGDDYDNGTAIARLIQRYEKDPDTFKATNPEKLPALALEVMKESSPSQEQDRILKEELSKVGLRWGREDEAHPYERAQQRLQWYQEQLSQQKNGKAVNQAALEIYETYMAPGDKAILSTEQMQINLQQMAPPMSPQGQDKSATAAPDSIHLGRLAQTLTELQTEVLSPTSPIKPHPLHKSRPSFS